MDLKNNLLVDALFIKNLPPRCKYIVNHNVGVENTLKRLQ